MVFYVFLLPDFEFLGDTQETANQLRWRKPVLDNTATYRGPAWSKGQLPKAVSCK